MDQEFRERSMSIIGCANCGGTHYGSNECPYLEKNMGEPCAVCGERTSYCCADCGIDGKGKVYLCVTDACRAAHEKTHPGAVARALAEDDARNFGCGFVRTYPDGRVEHIPHDQIIMHTRPNTQED